MGGRFVLSLHIPINTGILKRKFIQIYKTINNTFQLTNNFENE